MSKTRLLIPSASIALIALGVWRLWSLLLGGGPQEPPTPVGKATRPPEGARKMDGPHEFPPAGLEVPGDWMWQRRHVEAPYPILGDYKPYSMAPPAFSTYEWHLDEEGYIVRGHSEGKKVVKTAWNRPAFERDFKIVREEGGYSRDGHLIRFIGRPMLRLSDPRWLAFLKNVASAVTTEYSVDLWPLTIESDATGVIDCVLLRKSANDSVPDYLYPYWTGQYYSLYAINMSENGNGIAATGVLELSEFGAARKPNELLKWIGNAIDIINDWEGSSDPVLTESTQVNLEFWRNELERQEMAYGKRPFDRHRMIELTEEALRLHKRNLEYRRQLGLAIDQQVLDQHTAYLERDTAALARWMKEEAAGGK